MNIPKIPKSLYFGVFNTEEEMNQYYNEHKEELKEAYYGGITSGDENTPDSYQYSTRITNNDNTILAEYNKNDNYKEIKFIESIWGYIGWTWKSYEYDNQLLNGGYFTNFKQTNIVQTVDDGWRLQHINDFIRNTPDIKVIENFDTSNIICANNAFRRNTVTSSYLRTNIDNNINNFPSLKQANYMYYYFSVTNNNKIFNAPNLLIAKEAFRGNILQRLKPGIIPYIPFNRFNIPNIEDSTDFFINAIFPINDAISDIINYTIDEETNIYKVNVNINNLFISKFTKNTAIQKMFNNTCFLIKNNVYYEMNININVDELFVRDINNILLNNLSSILLCRISSNKDYDITFTIDGKNKTVLNIINDNHIINLYNIVTADVYFNISNLNNICSINQLNSSSNSIHKIFNLPFHNIINDEDELVFYRIDLTELSEEESYFDVTPNDNNNLMNYFNYARISSTFNIIGLNKYNILDFSYTEISKNGILEPFSFDTYYNTNEGIENQIINFDYTKASRIDYPISININKDNIGNFINSEFGWLSYLYIDDASNLTYNIYGEGIGPNGTSTSKYNLLSITCNSIVPPLLIFKSAMTTSDKWTMLAYAEKSINIDNTIDANISIDVNGGKKLSIFKLKGKFNNIDIQQSLNIDINSFKESLNNISSVNHMILREELYNSLNPSEQNRLQSICSSITLIKN